MVGDLVALLDLDERGPGHFIGNSPKDRWQRVFGGQVLGQALTAAARTVPDRLCHSLHAYFLRAGDPKTPIQYDVEASRDGGSFSARRVTAQQHGRAIFTMSASFQTPEKGLEHQTRMPDVPAPEDLPSEREWQLEAAQFLPEEARAWLLRARPIEIRAVEPRNRFVTGAAPARQVVWVRAVARLPDALPLHQAVLAYASDMTLLDTALLPHGINLTSRAIQAASLDHAIWFHHEFRADEWLLYVQDSPSASGGRGFARGEIFSRDGILIASVAQEGLIRLRKSALSD